MTTNFKSLDIARNLGVTTHTIRRWVARYPEYFSENARTPFRNQAIYTIDELRIILSIAELSKQGFGLKLIGHKLKEGYRYEGSLDDFQSLPTEPKVVSKKAVQALEDRINERDDLESQMLQRITELTNELTETKYQLGILQGKLDMLLQKN